MWFCVQLSLILIRFTNMIMSKELTIAVVLITYNQQDYVVEALEGIRSQSREPDEVIIADDGSKDATQQIILNYVNKYDLSGKWKLHLSPFNRGINENLQNAIDHTYSDIIIGMAGDDISLPNRCETTEQIFIAHPTCAMISTSGYVINKLGNVIGEQNQKPRIFQDVFEAVKHGNPRILPVGNSFRREVIYHFGALPFDLPNEDDQITFRALLLGGIACSYIKTFKYRIHNQSASAWLHRPQTSIEFFDRFKQDMSVRARHMHYWNVCLQKSNLVDRESLGHLLGLKEAFYRELEFIDTKPVYGRILLAIEFRSVISFKEVIFLLFGRLGIISWRFMRKVLGRL